MRRLSLAAFALALALTGCMTDTRIAPPICLQPAPPCRYYVAWNCDGEFCGTQASSVAIIPAKHWWEVDSVQFVDCRTGFNVTVSKAGFDYWPLKTSGDKNSEEKQ